ncbi:MAG: hypothetical protein FWD34_07910 [Oscillospiraceae bacterium]|nr:hypothetical protein [Oscillospiraceae bacterium]
MEINKINRNVLNTYKNISSAKPSEKKDGGAKPNVDKIEIDFERDFAKLANAAKSNIAGRLDAEANLARIQQLQKDYEGDNCPVSVEAVAESIKGE